MEDVWRKVGRCISGPQKGGLPAVPEIGWEYVPESTVLKAKKGVYGLNEAPLFWCLEHRDTIRSLEGAERSHLRHALFAFRYKVGKVTGLIGTHVDDDPIVGTELFVKNQVAKLRKLH